VAFNNRDDVPLEQLDTTEPLAPFVSPMAQGKPLVQNGSYERKSVQAAYLKPAVTITPQNVYDLALIARIREAGIISNTTQLTLEEKLRVAQIAGFDYLHRSIVNRKVLMGIDILTTGKTVIIGDDAPQRLV
ncbi:major capsid protein, partial [Streptomyces lunaelactis]|uniref:major capsid protein n=1 Tax=Streptomyces lunaelactis TaxID=1535768 RepID=UPI001585352F